MNYQFLRGMTVDSGSMLTDAGRDDHLLYTLVNFKLGSKAEGWLGYLCCPSSRDPPVVGRQLGTLEECCVVWSTNGAYTELEASESTASRKLNNPHIAVTQAC